MKSLVLFLWIQLLPFSVEPQPLKDTLDIADEDSANGFDILEKIETVDFRTGKRVQFSDEGDEIPHSNPPPMNDYNFGHELLKLEDINHRLSNEDHRGHSKASVNLENSQRQSEIDVTDIRSSSLKENIVSNEIQKDRAGQSDSQIIINNFLMDWHNRELKEYVRDQLRVLSLRALSAKSAVGIVDILTDPLDSRIADKFFYRRISKILAKSDRLQKLMQDCPKARVKTVLDVLTRENLNEVEAQLEKILGKWVCQGTEKKKKIVIKDATFKIDVSQFLKTSWKFVRDFFS